MFFCRSNLIAALERPREKPKVKKETDAASVVAEKTKAAAADTSREDGFATGIEKAGSKAEKKRNAPTFGEKVLSAIEPLLLRTKWKLWGNLFKNIVSKLLFGVLSH